MKRTAKRRAPQPATPTTALIPRLTYAPIRVLYPDGTYHTNYISEHGWRLILPHLNAGLSKDAAIRAVIPSYAPLRDDEGIPPCITTLGLEWPCSADAIRTRWHELAKKLHPDAGGDAAAFSEAKEAYDAATRLFEQEVLPW